MAVRFVLVPGAGGNPLYWYRVEPLLAAVGFECTAVALPNFDGATFADHGNAIVEAGTGASEVVLVAQSMGAFAAPLACDRLPVSELVLVNAMVPAPGESAGAWWAATDHAAAVRENDAREGREHDPTMHFEAYFLHDVPAEVIAQTADSEAGPAGSLFADPTSMRAWPAVRTTVLASRDDRFFPYPFQERVARERLGLEVEPLPGGHLVALSHPEALARRLLRGRVATPEAQASARS
jgi:pimeloyl-ACP methyl ester carboxylesterase